MSWKAQARRRINRNLEPAGFTLRHLAGDAVLRACMRQAASHLTRLLLDRDGWITQYPKLYHELNVRYLPASIQEGF